MAVTVAGSSITYSDSSVQTRKPLKLHSEVINSATVSNSFTALDGFNQYILVWDCVQFTGPASSSLTLTESTTSAAFSTKENSELLMTSSGLNNVSRTSLVSGSTNFLGTFGSGSNFTRGFVTITKLRGMSSTLPCLWNMEIAGGPSSNQWRANHRIGTSTTGSGGFGIGSLNLTLSSCNSINIRLYGIE
jgi:hypothetical protein